MRRIRAKGGFSPKIRRTAPSAIGLRVIWRTTDFRYVHGLFDERETTICPVSNFPILLPLIINSIRRSLELAEAMESRAFGATDDRTNLYELKMNNLDYIVLIVSIGLLIIAVYSKLYLPEVPSLLGIGHVFV